MYRQRYWTMRQYAGFGSARDSNRRYRYLLEQGQTGLSIAFDLPTQMGYDSDDPMARGEVGKVGVAIATIEDMRVLTDGLPLESVSVSMTINSTAVILLALLLAVARERGVSWEKLSGTVQNDLLKEYVARGTYIFPPRPSLKLTTDIFEFCGRGSAALEHDLDLRLPHPGGGLDGRAGSRIHAVQRDRVCRRGARARTPYRRLCSPHLLLLQRALELLRRDREVPRGAPALGGDRARPLRREGSPLVAAALPHADRGFDAHRAADGRQRRARRASGSLRRSRRNPVASHQRRGRGSGASDRSLGEARAADAAGDRLRDRASPTSPTRWEAPSSWRAWTEEIADRARALIARIDSLGGAVAAIETGFFAREIEEASYAAQRELEEGRRLVVGVNAFREKGDAGPPILSVDPRIEQEQVERLRAFRAARDTSVHAEKTLEKLKECVAEDRNLIPPILAAVEARATLGEVVGTLKTVWGEYRRSARRVGPALGAPAIGSAGCGLDRSPGPVLALRSRGARLLPRLLRETSRARPGPSRGGNPEDSDCLPFVILSEAKDLGLRATPPDSRLGETAKFKRPRRLAVWKKNPSR